ncbi:MAG: apolipoprotein N-acyltransferase [Acidimicrobiales bacterium]|nr:apolipoprotein N-acyltransferase [Acidimicrobiales bacterium]
MIPLRRIDPFVALRCVGAGLLICAALPPWGWWPLAFVGIAMIDGLMRDQVWKVRFARVFAVALAWLAPGMFWMIDLTPPGYLLAVLAYAAMFGLAAAISPGDRWRRLALPAGFVLAEALRWRWPFGGVPLATLPMTQAQSPLLPVARVAGSLLLAATVVVVGLLLAALLERHWKSSMALGGFVIVVIGLAAVAPQGRVIDSIEIAIVQGGGQQRTRATQEGAKVVFDRHIATSAQVNDGVDLVLWPENVVNPAPDPTGSRDPRRLYRDDAQLALSELAQQLDAPILPGWFYSISPTETINYTDVWLADGSVGDRYEKVRTVPFGEFVPLRGLLELFAKDVLPPRDVRPGTEPAVIETPVGPLAVSISWEIFFERRANDGVRNGGQLLVNPTNGSSYWLTILQTQQLASSQLRAVETGRWVVQAAPTGFSAVVAPDGDLVARTDISEQAVLHETVELRTGQTWAVQLGPRSTIMLAALVLLTLSAGSYLRLSLHLDEKGRGAASSS